MKDFWIEWLWCGVFVLAVLALVFIIVRSKRRDAQDIDVKSAERLKSTYPVQIPVENRSTVKKNWVLPVCLALLGVSFVAGGIIECVLPLFYDKIRDSEWFENGGFFVVTSLANVGVFVLGIIGIVLWVILGKRRLRTTANVVRIPAYVQSTFKNPKHGTRTVQLIFYDYKKDRLQMRTVSVDSYERQVDVLRKNDFVWIAADERRGSVRFVSLLEETPEREETSLELDLERLEAEFKQLEARMERTK